MSEQQDGKQSSSPASACKTSRRKTIWMYLAIFCTGLFTVLLLLFLLGFVLFVQKTVAIERPDNVSQVKGIIVLTGGRARLETGFSLLEKQPNLNVRLLISGVSPLITGRQNLAEILGLEPSFLECCVDLGREAINTKGNAVESAAWVKEHGYQQVLIVTNRYHMLRSLAELHHSMPETHLIPYPVERGSLFQPTENIKLFATEYAKYLVVRLRNFFNRY